MSSFFNMRNGIIVGVAIVILAAAGGVFWKWNAISEWVSSLSVSEEIPVVQASENEDAPVASEVADAPVVMETPVAPVVAAEIPDIYEPVDAESVGDTLLPALSATDADPYQPMESGSGSSVDTANLPVTTDLRAAMGYITLIDEIEIPAEETGVLKSLSVVEGSDVESGDTLAQIDDAQVLMALQVAQAKLDAAKIQAENDVNIRYAQAAWAVAKQEVAKAREANQRIPNTVPMTEVARLDLAVTQALLQIEQATHEKDVALYTMHVQEAELDAAKLNVEKKKIFAPITGKIIERFRHAGEWVKPGDPVLKIIQLDKVRIKFLVSSTIPQEKLLGHNVAVTIPSAKVVFTGKVTFIEQNIDQGMKYQVWAEIVNQKSSGGNWILIPGMPANVEVK